LWLSVKINLIVKCTIRLMRPKTYLSWNSGDRFGRFRKEKETTICFTRDYVIWRIGMDRCNSRRDTLKLICMAELRLAFRLCIILGRNRRICSSWCSRGIRRMRRCMQRLCMLRRIGWLNWRMRLIDSNRNFLILGISRLIVRGRWII
jgi:hypothetical protein